MKPQPIDLRGVGDARELVRRVLHTRFDEVRRLTGGLEQRDERGLHDFRIAAKRLRYAVERFCKIEPSLESFAQVLSRLQDALGDAHDRDVLLHDSAALDGRHRAALAARSGRAASTGRPHFGTRYANEARACTLIFLNDALIASVECRGLAGGKDDA